MQTTSIPTVQTANGELPVFVFPVDHELPVAEQVEVGDTIAFFSRGRFRAAKVVKVTAKRVTAEYTTQGAYDEAVKAAQFSHEGYLLRQAAHSRKMATEHLATADLIESGRPVDRHVARSIERHGVGYAAMLREWARNADAAGDQASPEFQAKLAEARAQDAVPFEQRVIEATHVTSKNVSRGDVFAVEGS